MVSAQWSQFEASYRSQVAEADWAEIVSYKSMYVLEIPDRDPFYRKRKWCAPCDCTYLPPGTPCNPFYRHMKHLVKKAVQRKEVVEQGIMWTPLVN
jgi:hypothetical protein